MASRRKARILALQTIYSWDLNEAKPEDLLDFAWLDAERRAKLSEPTAIFARHLIQGTIENIQEIDGLIQEQVKNWDIARLSKVDLALLRMSVFSLLYQKDIPPAIVINEAIDIAQDFGSDDSFRFINGVLDALRKKIEQKGVE